MFSLVLTHVDSMRWVAF